MSRIKRGILRRNGVESLSQRRARFGQIFPAIGRRRDVCRGRQWRLIDHRTRHRNDVIVLCPLHHVARSAIVRRPLVSGALSEDITQTQEDEDRQRQEDDGINIHVAFRFLILTPATGPAVERSLKGTAEITSWMGQQYVGTKLGLANGAFLARKAMPVEIGQAGALTRLPQANCSAFSARGETPMLPGNRAYSTI